MKVISTQLTAKVKSERGKLNVIKTKSRNLSSAESEQKNAKLKVKPTRKIESESEARD